MRTVLLLVAALLLAGPPAPAAAQDAPAPAAAAPVTNESPAPAAYGSSAPAATGLARPAPPRTLRAYWHLFVAFAVAWVLIFGYTVAIARRFGRIERELDALRTR
jgi:CcmD family protein